MEYDVYKRRYAGEVLQVGPHWQRSLPVTEAETSYYMSCA
jgi:hypothetical protein